MSTRSLVGTGTIDAFKASHVHLDGYPTGRGPLLFRLFRERGVTDTISTIVDHTWSFLETDSDTNQFGHCYCHNAKNLDGTHRNLPHTPADESWLPDTDAEYIWLVGEDARLTLHTRHGSSWLEPVWRLILSVDVSPEGLKYPEPNWLAIEESEYENA